MTVLETDQVTKKFWGDIAPQIPELLKIKPKDSLDKPVSSWGSAEFIEYYRRVFKTRFGYIPPVASKAKSGAIFKTKIIDYFYEQVQLEIKDFIDYTIANARDGEDVQVEFLSRKLVGYMAYKYRGFQKEQGKMNTRVISNLAEKQGLDFYRDGNVSRMSKDEFFIHLACSGGTKNYSRCFSDEKFKRWFEEFSQIESEFNVLKEFYFLEAKKRGKTVAEILKIYSKENDGIFSAEELNASIR